MKIVFYTDQMYLHGGIEKMLSNKLNYFSKLENYEIHLITFEQKDNPYCYFVPENIIIHDLNINYNRDISYFKFKNLRKVPKHIINLKKLLNKISPDILIVANYSFDFYFIPLIKDKVKIIKEYHSSRYKNTIIKLSLKRKIFNKLIEKVNSWYDYIIVLNDDEKQLYSTNNVEVIPNCIKIDTDTKDHQTREKRIISAGRIAPVKQFDHIIKAWEEIAIKYPNWFVEIYGDGDEELLKKYNKYISDKNIKNIRFMSSTIELDKIMQSSSIFLLSSETECFPMVLLESLKNGLPIISYKSPYGPQNIITDGKDGILSNYNDIEKLAQSLDLLINDKNKLISMREDAIKNINRFSEEIIMQKWIKLFRNSIDKNKSKI